MFADVSARRFRSSRKELLQYGQTMMDTAVAHDDQELITALKKNKYAIGLNFAILWAIEQNYDSGQGPDRAVLPPQGQEEAGLTGHPFREIGHRRTAHPVRCRPIRRYDVDESATLAR